MIFPETAPVENPMPIANVAPGLTVISPEPVALPVPFSTVSVPALTVVDPVYVLLRTRTNPDEPVLFSPDAPEIVVSMVRFPPATEISAVPLEAARFNVPLPRIVRDRVVEFKVPRVIVPLSMKLPSPVGCVAMLATASVLFGAFPPAQFEPASMSPGLTAVHVVVNVPFTTKLLKNKSSSPAEPAKRLYTAKLLSVWSDVPPRVPVNVFSAAPLLTSFTTSEYVFGPVSAKDKSTPVRRKPIPVSRIPLESAML